MRGCFRRDPNTIVEAAAELFHERGYARTSLQAIADRSGFPKGNFYYHFRRKADILRAVVKIREAQLRREIDSLRKSNPDPVQRLEDFHALWNDHPDLHHMLGCPHGTLAFEIARDEPALLTHVRAPLDLLLDWLRRELHRAGRENAEHEAERLLSDIQGQLAMSAALELNARPAAPSATHGPRTRSSPR